MFIAPAAVTPSKLRRSGMSMSPLTGLGFSQNAGAIHIPLLRSSYFSNRLSMPAES